MKTGTEVIGFTFCGRRWENRWSLNEQSWEGGGPENMSRNTQTDPLRNEAQLNCISLRSSLDDELGWRAVKGQDERQKTAPLTALHPTLDLPMEDARKNKYGKAATSALTFMTFSVRPRFAPKGSKLSRISTGSSSSACIKEYDDKIEELANQKYGHTKLLRQVKGVGPITALAYDLTRITDLVSMNRRFACRRSRRKERESQKPCYSTGPLRIHQDLVIWEHLNWPPAPGPYRKCAAGHLLERTP